MSTLSVGTIKSASSAAPIFQNSSGTEKGQLAKAWVNFDGTGTIAIRDDFNVSSLTDNGTGDYTVTYSNAMSNTDYSVFLTSADIVTGGSESRIVSSPRTKATGSYRISTNGVGSSQAFDCVQTNLVIFGAN